MSLTCSIVHYPNAILRFFFFSSLANSCNSARCHNNNNITITRPLIRYSDTNKSEMAHSNIANTFIFFFENCLPPMLPTSQRINYYPFRRHRSWNRSIHALNTQQTRSVFHLGKFEGEKRTEIFIIDTSRFIVNRIIHVFII